MGFAPLLQDSFHPKASVRALVTHECRRDGQSKSRKRYFQEVRAGTRGLGRAN
jgi:hypothetical protein